MSILVVIALALAAQANDEPPIIVIGRPWAPFISPMGEPFRARTAGDDPLARWFHQADQNHDGLLTADEMETDARRFFATLDSNADQVIDPEELVVYESEIAPEVQVNSRWKLAPQSTAAGMPDDRKRRRVDRNIDGYQIHGLQGAARYGLLNLPQPVAAADADFNRGTTLDEFSRAAAHRFQLLDSKRAGHLILQDLEPLLPTRPEAKARVKHPKNAVDTRIGLPFPKGD